MLKSTATSSAALAAILRPTQAAQYLGISRSYLYLLIAREQFTLIKLGGRASGLLRQELDAWLGQKVENARAA